MRYGESMKLTARRARKIRAGIRLSIQVLRNERLGPREWDDSTLMGRAFHKHHVRHVRNIIRANYRDRW